MTLQAVTLYLPSAFYQKIAQRARQERRSIEDELVAVVTAALPDLNDLPGDLAREIAQLAVLTDAELTQAAQTTLTPQDTDQMQALMLKRQREGLTRSESQAAELLVKRYDRTLLIRAQAAALLKERGHDLDWPIPLDAR
jgi:hypothetical protein